MAKVSGRVAQRSIGEQAIEGASTTSGICIRTEATKWAREIDSRRKHKLGVTWEMSESIWPLICKVQIRGLRTTYEKTR